MSQALAQTDLQTMPFSGQTRRALRATAITGLTTAGQYVYGQTIELGQVAVSRGTAAVAYDSAQLADTDGDTVAGDLVCGDVFPHAGFGSGSRYFFNNALQTNAEDIVPHPGTEGGIVDELTFLGVRFLCPTVLTEQLTIVFESWEGFDNFPDLDGSDGFDTDGDGLGFPASRTDADGDTFIDEFLGGVALDFGELPENQGGFSLFAADGLSLLGVPLTSNLDQWDGGNPGTDGRPDGGVRINWTRGDGGDGMGPLNGGLYPASFAFPALWGTLAMEIPGTQCPFAGSPGFGVGDSTGIFWSESNDFCDPMGGGIVDDVYDLSTDVNDWTGIVPDFMALGPAFRISVIPETTGSDCCDANGDGACSPADFSAWIAAFGAGSARCDVNQDGSCAPADFSAWVAAFNASAAGSPLSCQF